MRFYFDIPEGRLESTAYYSNPIPEWKSQNFDPYFFLTKLLPALEEGKVAVCGHCWGELDVSILYWPGELFDNEDRFIAQFSIDIQRRIQVLKTRQREERKSYED
jgi:hypothetical protein